MLANPSEYRDTLWDVLQTGEPSAEMKKKLAEKAPERARAAVGKPTPKQAIKEMEALLEQAASLKAEREKT